MNRQPEGIPTGGQFAASAKGEPDVDLDQESLTATFAPDPSTAIDSEEGRKKEIFSSVLSTEKLAEAVFEMTGTDGEPAWKRIDSTLEAAEDFYERTLDSQYTPRHPREVVSESLAESGISLADVEKHRSEQRVAKRVR